VFLSSPPTSTPDSVPTLFSKTSSPSPFSLFPPAVFVLVPPSPPLFFFLLFSRSFFFWRFPLLLSIPDHFADVLVALCTPAIFFPFRQVFLCFFHSSLSRPSFIPKFFLTSIRRFFFPPPKNAVLKLPDFSHNYQFQFFTPILSGGFLPQTVPPPPHVQPRPALVYHVPLYRVSTKSEALAVRG